MADEVVSSLITQGGFDPGNLAEMPQFYREQLRQAQLAVTQAQRQFPALDLPTDKAETSLAHLGQSVEKFFASFAGAPVTDAVAAIRSINEQLAAGGQPGFLDDLIPTLRAAREGFASTSVEARELDAVIAELTTSKRALASVQPPAPIDPPPLEQFEAFRRESADVEAQLAGLPRILDVISAALTATGGTVGDVVTQFRAINTALEATGQTGFLEALVPVLEETRAGFAANSVEAQQFQAIIEQLSVAEHALASNPPPPPPPPPPTDQFSAFRREVTSAKVAVSELAATMAQGNAGNLAWAQGSARLAAEQAVVNAELAEGAKRAAQWAAAATVSTNVDPMVRGLENIRIQGLGARQELVQGQAAFKNYGASAKTAVNALVSLAAGSLGVEGTVGRLAQQILLLAGGTSVVALVAGAVLGAVKAFEFLTTAEREANQEREQTLKSLIEEAKNADVAAKAQRDLAAVIREAAEARAQAANRAQFAGGGSAGSEGGAEAIFDAVAAELNRRAQKDAIEATKGEAQARLNLHRIEVKGLTDALSLNVATAAEREHALDILRQDVVSLKASNLPLQERLRLQQEILDIQKAITAETQRAAASARLNQTAGDINAVQQENVNAVEQGLKAQEQLIKQSTARSVDDQLAANRTMFAQLAQLRQQSAAADIAQFKVQLGNAQVDLGAAQTDQQRRDAQGQIDHLQAQIDLRKQVLGTQLSALENEHRLADATAQNLSALLEFQRQIRIVTAGGGNQLGGAPPVRDERTITSNVPEGVAQLPEILRGIGQTGVTKALEAGLKRDLDAADRLNRAFHQTLEGLQGIGAAAANIGLIGRAAQHALGGVLDLIGGVQDLKKANADLAAAIKTNDPAELATAKLEKLGATLGLVGTGLSLFNTVGGILAGGPTAAERERNAILAENNQRLAELRESLDQSLAGGAGAAVLRDTIADLLQNANLLRLAQGSGESAFSDSRSKTGALLGNPMAELASELAQANLSLQDFARQVKDATGINILDSKGRVVAAAFQQAADAIEEFIRQATTFGTSISDVQQQIQLDTDLGLRPDLTSPDANVQGLNINRAVLLEGFEFPPEVEAAIRQLDLSTEAGRQAFLEWERQIRQMIQSGFFTENPDVLGKFFGDIPGLINILDDSAKAILGLGDAADEATHSMLNLPSGFKINRLAFNASDFGVPVPTPSVPITFSPNVDPGSLRRGTDGASLPAFGSVTIPSITLNVSSKVENVADLADEITDLVVDGIRQKLQRQGGGDGANWSAVT